MSGPPPKHVSVKARRNKASTRAELTEPEGEVEIPPLPPHFEEVNGKFVEIGWHPLTVGWWDAIWPSPMAQEWHSSDIYGLYAVAFLYDKFFRHPNEKTHGELRLARQPFGLTPIDRRKLEWTIGGVEKVTRENRRAAQQVAASTTPTPSTDTDLRLRVV
jgi:hypothetical protein